MRLFKIALMTIINILVMQNFLVFGVEEKLQALVLEDETAINFFQDKDVRIEVLKQWTYLVAKRKQVSPYLSQSQLRQFGPLLLTSKSLYESMLWTLKSIVKIPAEETLDTFFLTKQHTVKSIVAGYYHTCAIGRVAEQLHCWGNWSYGQRMIPPELFNKAVLSVAADEESPTCAIEKETQKLRCWAALGDNALRPLPESLVHKSFSVVSVGWMHKCAIEKDTKKLFCWGKWRHNESQNLQAFSTLVNYSFPAVSIPVDYIDKEFLSVATARSHTCAIESGTHRLYCWGSDDLEGRRSVPARLAKKAFSKVVAGLQHFCAIEKDTHRLYCWQIGYFNEHGPLPSLLPNLELLGKAFLTVDVRAYRSCAIEKDTHRVYCWGGYDDSINIIPQKIANKSVSDIAVGLTHTCAIERDRHQLLCWGKNDRGQLDWLRQD